MLKLILPTTSLLLLLSQSTNNSRNWYTACVSLLILTTISIPMNYCPLSLNSALSMSLFMDSLSAPLISLTLWVSALMILASSMVLNKNNSSSSFLMYVLLLNLILMLTFMAKSLITFYILFEASLIPTMMLVLGWGYQPERLQASLYLMMYTITASLPLLLSVTSMFDTNLHLSMLFPMWCSPSSITYTQSIWWTLTIMAFMVKMPLYITHLWLPKAHVEAPVAGSMVLAGILLKLGSYGLIRISSLFQEINFTLLPMFSSIALWGAVITGIVCMRQTDMKSLIAYSSVGHMGLMTAGIMSSSLWGWNGGLALMIAHGLCSSALFALANMAYEATQSRSLFLSKGLMTFFPMMTMWWFILSASNMAAPPSINLFSEIMLITANIAMTSICIIPIAIMSFLAAAYSLILYTSTQHGAASTFANPMNMNLSTNHYITTLHALPIVLLMLKPELISNV